MFIIIKYVNGIKYYCGGSQWEGLINNCKPYSSFDAAMSSVKNYPRSYHYEIVNEHGKVLYTTVELLPSSINYEYDQEKIKMMTIDERRKRHFKMLKEEGKL